MNELFLTGNCCQCRTQLTPENGTFHLIVGADGSLAASAYCKNASICKENRDHWDRMFSEIK